MSNNNILVLDFETVGYAPKESMNPNVCDPVQIAVVPIDGKTMQVKYDKSFSSMIKPSKSVDLIDKETLQWHSEKLKKSPEELKKAWNEAPVLSVVWNSLLSYIDTHRTSKTSWGLPILAGHNIRRFDCIILERIQRELGPKDKAIFHEREFIDTMNYLWFWLEDDTRVKSYSLDNLRKFFGMSEDGGHEALQDCKDCAAIFARFMRHQRNQAKKVNFANQFKDWKDKGLE
jgi:DNA polymerase III epsilon subunit-like protein